MKKHHLAGMLVLQSLSAGAFAESPLVTIYGSVDDGLSYVSNVGGKKSTKMMDGINKANALGFKGSEDLGGGMHAFFKLENGFNLNNGAMGQGLIFGKQALVGIAKDRIGEISIGRQYDYTVQLERYMPYLNNGIMAFQNADLDRTAGQRLNNSIQFNSAKFSGLSFGTMYAFGETAATVNMSTNMGRAISANVQYEQGPFSAGLVYTDIDKAPVLAGYTGVQKLLGVDVTKYPGFFVDNQTITGLAAQYKFGDWKTSAMYTNTKLELKGLSATDQLFALGAAYRVRPAVELATKISADKLDDSRWYSLTTSVDYQFSKRTDVYLELAGQKAKGQGTTAALAAMGPSSTDKQFVSRIGLRHFF